MGARVLVVYASETGSTEGIASVIGDRLAPHAAVVDVRPVASMGTVSGYDAVVIGSAVHNRALLPAAEKFVQTNLETLRTLPVWLFSVGIGPSLRGPIGGRLARAVPERIAWVRDQLRPRDYHAFAGTAYAELMAPPARIFLRLLGGRFGDLRDWAAIKDWADRIGVHLDRRSVSPEGPNVTAEN